MQPSVVVNAVMTSLIVITTISRQSRETSVPDNGLPNNPRCPVVPNLTLKLRARLRGAVLPLSGGVKGRSRHDERKQEAGAELPTMVLWSCHRCGYRLEVEPNPVMQLHVVVLVCKRTLMMKFGIVPINIAEFTNPELVIPFVQRAEALGYESVWTAEHVIIPTTYESVYPYHPSGKLRFAPDIPIVDPLVALTYIASATTTLRLGTGVNILPQMSPLYLAKWASSLDHLSQGRLMLGLGIGWLREEFEAIGVPFERRGKRADEYLQALKAVWTGDEVHVQGEFVNWQNFVMRPKPVQPGGVPLIVGGVTPPAIRRLVAYGDGWYVVGKDLPDYRSHLKALDDECARQGRNRADLEITAYWNYHGEGVESLAGYEELGVDRLLINMHALREADVTAALDRFADEVIAKHS